MGRVGSGRVGSGRVTLFRRSDPRDVIRPVECLVFLSRLIADHDPTTRSYQEFVKLPRVERCRVRRCFKSHGTGRVGSGRVGSGRVGSGRVGSDRVGSGRVGSGWVGSIGSGRSGLVGRFFKCRESGRVTLAPPDPRKALFLTILLM